MLNVIKILGVTVGLTLAFTASTPDNIDYNSSKHLILDDLYACGWWPVCKDPEEQTKTPVPSDSSLPKPTGDKDTSKDKKDEARLA